MPAGRGRLIKGLTQASHMPAGQENLQPQVMPVRFSTETGVWTHTLRHAVLWSVIRNKFIKGRPHGGLVWGIDYLVLPGVYLLWGVNGFRDNRGLEFYITKIRIIGDYQAEHIEDVISIHLTMEDLRNMLNDTNCPEALKDFIGSIPSRYHDIGTIPNTEKAYPPDEVERVKKYLEEWLRKQAEY